MKARDLLSRAALVSCMITGVTVSEEIRIAAVGIKPHMHAHVPAQEAGVLFRIHVREGQRVTAGTLLAELDDRDAKLDLEQARIELQNAVQRVENDLKIRSNQELLKLAKLDLKRAHESISRYAKSVSQSELDRLEAAITHAELDVEQAKKDRQTAKLALLGAENQLLMAKRKIQRRKLIAPIDGTVVAISSQQGEWVEVGKGVVRVIDTSKVKAEGFVKLSELTRDLDQSSVTLNVRLPNTGSSTFPGRVTFVSPEANQVNGQVRIWAAIENRDGKIFPGMSGTLLIHDAVPPADKVSVRTSVLDQ